MKETVELKRIKTKIKALVLLIAFTAVMLIISTYAWFSTQRTVNISGIDGTVNVAEGLEISLDARNWSNSLDLSGISNLKGYASINGYTTNNNIVPTELLPVSTQGSTGGTTLRMYKGDARSSTTLSYIELCDESITDSTYSRYPNYIAFDVFLRDSSRTNADVPLYLTTNSTVMVKSNGENEEQYGLQNTIRVGFAKYGITSDYKADQTTIITETASSTNTISQVSIWEPNANYHVNYTVINNNKFTVYGLTGAILRDTDGTITDSTSEDKIKFTRDDLINTYALKDGVSNLRILGARG